MIQFTTLSSEEDIHQVLALQQANLPANITTETADSQGFVTVQHDFDLLKKMNDAIPQVVARKEDTIVGYALVMLPAFQEFIPVLKPMFGMFREIDYHGKKISACQYYVMGQICVAEGYRGQGVFDGMYQQHRVLFANKFDFCVTEISTRNTRSLRAHQRLGFETVHTFRDETDHWEIVIWDWK
jgi:L-amino acid N-acyltransferase YncA